MLLLSANPFKCHEDVLYLQSLIPPKRFLTFSPLTGGCSKDLDEFRFFFKNINPVQTDFLILCEREITLFNFVLSYFWSPKITLA